MSGISLRSLLPQISERLRPGETILVDTGMDAVTVLDGPGGFLDFRRWEMKKNDAGNAYWELMDTFVLGSQCRSALGDLLQRRWSGCIFSEAATLFKNGESCIEQEDAVDLATAKAWVVAKVNELLKEEEQISQALVIGPESSAFEYLPNTWGGNEPAWEDASPLDGEEVD